MARVNPPCKECTKETGRYPGCHDHCTKPEYIAWREEQAKRKKAEEKERIAKARYNEVKSDNISQTIKKYGIKSF